MTKKTYNVQVAKFYDKDIQSPVLEITATEQIITLLDNFAIKTAMKDTVYNRKPREENEPRMPSDYVKRYLVKTVLLNTVNDESGWDNIFDLLFTPEMFNDKKIRIALSSNSAFYDLETKARNIRFLIASAEKLLTSKKINVTFESEVAKDE